MKKKLCNHCKDEKTLDNFSAQSKGWCRKCKTDSVRERRHAHAKTREKLKQQIDEGVRDPDPVIPDGQQQCINCKDIKDLEEFHKNNGYNTGHRSTCINCVNSKKREKAVHKPKSAGTHKCIRCKDDKNVSEFYKDRSRPSGLRDWCKECVKTYNEQKYDEEEIPATKECNACGNDLPLENFTKNKYGKYYRSNDCIKCRNIARRLVNNKRIINGTKYCRSCQTTKEVSKFHADKSNKDGLQIYCAVCKVRALNMSSSKFEAFVDKLFTDLKKNATKRNIAVKIKLSDILDLYKEQNGRCVYTDILMTHDRIPKENSRLTNPHNISVDRIDSTCPYTKTNIQLVCVIVNLIKYDMTENDFLNVCIKVAKSQKSEEFIKQQQYQDAIKNILETDIKTVKAKSFSIAANYVYDPQRSFIAFHHLVDAQ